MSRKTGRKGQNRKTHINVLIICAETEEAYLKAYFQKNSLPKHIKICYETKLSSTPSLSTYSDNLRHINKAYKIEYYKIYHIFDLERPNPNDRQVRAMLDYIEKCKKGKIKPILQMPSVEVWFLQHFEDVVSVYNDSDNAEKQLKKYFTGYDKNNTPCWNNVINETAKGVERYEVQKDNYSKLEGVFKQYNITNPMMQIADLLQELQQLKDIKDE